MIGSLKGKITLKTGKFVILDVNMVGYKINLSPDTLSKIKTGPDLVSFWTHTHVREDSLELYGFKEREELVFFELLLNVSGIGPKGALNILSIAPLENLKKAVASGDVAYLTKISGIGKKTAEKIVLELRDKLETFKSEGDLQGELDALEALKSLGYSQNEAREALKKIPADMNTNNKLKEALKILSNFSKTNYH